jgi:hypothetical protein
VQIGPFESGKAPESSVVKQLAQSRPCLIRKLKPQPLILQQRIPATLQLGDYYVGQMATYRN